MSELRDRLATAIRTRWHDMTLEETWEEGSYILADAVIEELKLRRDTVGLIHRHVTEWTTDE
jgi:hypothetical protein